MKENRPLNWHACIEVEQSKKRFFLTKLTAEKLVKISYASVRGHEEEEGAVQRILNPRRIASLKQFALERGIYPSSVVLNWVSEAEPLQRKDGGLLLPSVARVAQIIDGQHRIAGLREAISEDPSVGKVELPVSIYERLDTAGCAEIFLSINTEQRPVPRSLVIDLYGELSEDLIDRAALRARDIAMMLQESEESPYRELIKLPGAPRTHGGVALSTVVSAIKPLVEDKGILEQQGISELEMQFKAICNFLKALEKKYGDSWESKKDNAFLFGAGFTGAMEFFAKTLVPYCGKDGDFTQEHMTAVLTMARDSLIRPSDTTGLSGRAAVAAIVERLKKCFSPKAPVMTTLKI